MTTAADKPKAGLEDTVATSSAICYLDGDRGVLAYCGYDIHDLARSARTYGATDYFVVHPITVQRELVVLDPVEHLLLPNRVGYVHVRTFSAKTTDGTRVVSAGATVVAYGEDGAPRAFTEAEREALRR